MDRGDAHLAELPDAFGIGAANITYDSMFHWGADEITSITLGQRPDVFLSQYRLRKSGWILPLLLQPANAFLSFERIQLSY